MATIRTGNTSHIAEKLLDLYQDVVEDVRWVAQKAFYTAQRVQDGNNVSVDDGMARAYVPTQSNNSLHMYTFFGQNLGDRQQAAASTWEIDVEQPGETEAGVARIGSFNPWSSTTLQLNGYAGKFSEQEKEGGYSSTEASQFSFASDAAFTATYAEPSNDYYHDDYEIHGHVSVQASANSRIYSASGESSEKTKDGRESHNEVSSYELQSKSGLALNDSNPGGTLDSLRYSSKGTAVEDGRKLAWDEAYQFNQPLEGFAQLIAAAQQNVSGALEQLTQLLLSGDDNITLTGKLAGELRGGAGNDSLTGGKGNDFLSGDAGADILEGGAGKDIFSFAAGDASLDAPDVVLDFKTRQDKLHLQIDASASEVFKLSAKQASLESLLESAAGAFAQGSQVVFGSDGRTGYVVVDSDGDSQADMLIELAGIKSASKLAVGDFLFG